MKEFHLKHSAEWFTRLTLFTDNKMREVLLRCSKVPDLGTNVRTQVTEQAQHDVLVRICRHSHKLNSPYIHKAASSTLSQKYLMMSVRCILKR